MTRLTKRMLLAICMLAGYAIPALADIRLPHILADNMVLSRETTVTLWGWANASEKIFVTTSWNDRTDSTVTGSGAKWSISIPTPAAGGPYTITFKGNNTITLKNIMIGEVWLCSGQSNMQWSGQMGLPEIKAELPQSYNPNIRFMEIPRITSEYPQDDCLGSWEECGPESLNSFSAVGYFFGKKLQQELGIPIGLINASWGGTAAQVWTPTRLMEEDSILQPFATKVPPAPWWPNEPASAYNAMIAPITPFNIAGVIWYQGESNTAWASTYTRLMNTMIDGWRAAFKKEFPFYYVQIAPFAYDHKNVGALVREAQTETLSHPKTGMVVITDLVENIKDIHPIQKREVGERLAGWALAETYHKGNTGYKSPQFSRMTIEKNKAIVHFDNAAGGLVLKQGDKKATEFYISGEDRQFLPADVQIKGEQVILSNKQIKNPVAVRFAFGNAAIGNIFSKQGLPVNPFRTDNWEVDTSKRE